MKPNTLLINTLQLILVVDRSLMRVDLQRAFLVVVDGGVDGLPQVAPPCKKVAVERYEADLNKWRTQESVIAKLRLMLLPVA